MFRRTPSPAPSETTAPGAGADETATSAQRPAGKGRPTPTRKEAEAAARARAKPARSRKELAARDRAQRVERNKEAREALRNGDESRLPARDKGPVRRLVRDLVDARFGFTELTLPLLVVALVMQYSGQPNLVSMGVTITMMMFLLIVLDVLWLRTRLRREVRRRFPDQPMNGLLFYAITRSLQIRPLRLPKAQVKIGTTLPEEYR